MDRIKSQHEEWLTSQSLVDVGETQAEHDIWQTQPHGQGILDCQLRQHLRMQNISSEFFKSILNQGCRREDLNALYTYAFMHEHKGSETLSKFLEVKPEIILILG